MPVLINEVIAEIQDTVTEPQESQPAAQQQPLSAAEADLSRTLEIIQQRQQRLLVD